MGRTAASTGQPAVKRYLLDTNIVSYFLNGIHPGLHGRMRLALQAAGGFARHALEHGG